MQTASNFQVAVNPIRYPKSNCYSAEGCGHELLGSLLFFGRSSATPMRLIAALVVISVARASPRGEAGDDLQYAMHEAWCAVRGHEKHGPCEQHRVMHELRNAMKQLRNAMKQIEQQYRGELFEAQNREMNNWFCGRKEAIDAAPGSALHDYCRGWEAHKLRTIHYQMLEAWCSLRPDREQQSPCMKHRTLQHLGPDADANQIKQNLTRIDQQFGPELLKAQNRQMHDWWCEQKSSFEAPAGSVLRTFCDGWEASKRDEALKQEV